MISLISFVLGYYIELLLNHPRFNKVVCCVWFFVCCCCFICVVHDKFLNTEEQRKQLANITHINYTSTVRIFLKAPPAYKLLHQISNKSYPPNYKILVGENHGNYCWYYLTTFQQEVNDRQLWPPKKKLNFDTRTIYSKARKKVEILDVWLYISICIYVLFQLHLYSLSN